MHRPLAYRWFLAIVACLVAPRLVGAQEAPRLALLDITGFRAPNRDVAGDEALSKQLTPLVSHALERVGVPVVGSADADLAVITQYTEIGSTARLEVGLVRRPDGEIVARRVTTPDPASDPEVLANLIAAGIQRALREYEASG